MRDDTALLQNRPQPRAACFEMKSRTSAKCALGCLAATAALFVLHSLGHHSNLDPYRTLAVVASLGPRESIQRTDDLTPGKGNNGRRFLLHNVDQGRLGNTMFHLGSTLCIAIQNNLTLLLEDTSDRLDVFEQTPEVVRVKSAKNMSLSPLQTHSQRIGCCCYDESFGRLDPASHHLVHGYFQSWRFIEPCKQQVLRAVAFTEPIQRQASGILRNLRETFRGKILVGVHVRMEDYVQAVSNGYGWRIADAAYYLKAMTYFRAKLGHEALFVVMTSDPDWFRRNVTQAADDVHFLARSPSPAVDLEVLSGLDHFIMSVGTYGWWAAYKSQGTVVCYKDLFVPGSGYARQFNHTVADFLHPSWVAL